MRSKFENLKPCPRSPNCVSSQASLDDTVHYVEPLPLGVAADPVEKLSQVILQLPRTKIIIQTEEYLRVEFRSLIFRFVDDAEFLLDRENQLIHVRSASRIGYSDMGANRKRLEVIRNKWQPWTC